MSEQQPAISVVLPVRNGASLLARQLARLSGQRVEIPWEVIVADNGSSDGSARVAELMASSLPHLTVVDASASPGRAGAVNEGVAHARSELIATCDHDDAVALDWVAGMATALSRSELVAGAVLIEEEPLDPSRLALDLPAKPLVHGSFRPYAMGCNMGFTRRLWASLGGFDSRMDGAEDVDFSWRAIQQGVPVRFEQDIRVLKARHSELPARYRQHVGFGRADVRLRERFHSSGYTRLYLRTGRQAIWLGLHVTSALPGSRSRSHWLATAGRVTGVLTETLRSRLHDDWLPG